ncbi:MAG: hypothetical protein KIT27_02280 [Legionellales bacterium]|nr:hypothetical protein [Legionellales bacterium]
MHVFTRLLDNFLKFTVKPNASPLEEQLNGDEDTQLNAFTLGVEFSKLISKFYVIQARSNTDPESLGGDDLRRILFPFFKWYFNQVQHTPDKLEKIRNNLQYYACDGIKASLSLSTIGLKCGAIYATLWEYLSTAGNNNRIIQTTSSTTKPNTFDFNSLEQQATDPKNKTLTFLRNIFIYLLNGNYQKAFEKLVVLYNSIMQNTIANTQAVLVIGQDKLHEEIEKFFKIILINPDLQILFKYDFNGSLDEAQKKPIKQQVLEPGTGPQLSTQHSLLMIGKLKKYFDDNSEFFLPDTEDEASLKLINSNLPSGINDDLLLNQIGGYLLAQEKLNDINEICEKTLKLLKNEIRKLYHKVEPQNILKQSEQAFLDNFHDCNANNLAMQFPRNISHPLLNIAVRSVLNQDLANEITQLQNDYKLITKLTSKIAEPSVDSINHLNSVKELTAGIKYREYGFFEKLLKMIKKILGQETYLDRKNNYFNPYSMWHSPREQHSRDNDKYVKSTLSTSPKPIN